MRRGNSASLLGTTVETGADEEASRVIAAAQLEVQLAKLKAESYPQINPALMPMLSVVPANAEVAIIGVYEAASGTHGRGLPRTPGVVRISVMPSSKPLVLVLTNYEPVRWVVHNPGRKISAVLLSGYYETTALGLSNVPVLKIGSTSTYKAEGGGLDQLKREIARYVLDPVKSF